MLLRRGVAASRLSRPLGRSYSAHGASCTPIDTRRGSALQFALPRVYLRHATTVAQESEERTPRQAEASGARQKESSPALVRNPGLSEKWGWSETAHRWYYPLKALGVFSKKNTRALASSRMLQTCLNNAERKEWYADARISNEFLPKLLWLSTNVWLLSRRLLKEGEEGKKVQELLFDELWRETKRQMRSIQVSEMMLKKYLSEAQQHTFITLVQYDHACTLEDREERLGLLANALWRGVYMSNESIKMPLARTMAEYVDSELNDMYALDAEDFFAVCIEFAPPPTGLKQIKQLAKGGSKRPKDKDARAKGPLGDVGETVAATAPVEGGRQDKVLHGDFGDEGTGRWRASLAESGKVYYWHTRTREVTWDKPVDCDAFVPSIMPKTDASTTATATA